MIIRSPILRTAVVLTSKLAPKFGGDAHHGGGVHNKAFLDPRKHIGMYKYEVPAYYDEYWPTGFYPQTYVRGSQPSTTYQPKVEQVLLKTLNSRYNTNLTIENISTEDLTRFFKRVLKTEDNPAQFISSLNIILSKQIIVKQSRWTWIRQQQHRATVGAEILKNMEFNTFEQFFRGYNFMIEQLIQISNFGLSPNIPQELNAQQKHLLRQLQNEQVEGISDLNDTSREQNNNLINRFMRYLHSA